MPIHRIQPLYTSMAFSQHRTEMGPPHIPAILQGCYGGGYCAWCASCVRAVQVLAQGVNSIFWGRMGKIVSLFAPSRNDCQLRCTRSWLPECPPTALQPPEFATHEPVQQQLAALYQVLRLHCIPQLPP